MNREERKLSPTELFDVRNLRKAAEVHRQVRKYIQSYIRPGVSLVDMCIKLESMLKFIMNSEGLHCGQAFPTGCSLNNVAAHYTPNPGDDDVVLKYDDVCKLDFGTHVDGLVIDCAFTIAFNSDYDNLLLASKDGTTTGIKLAGVDARLGEIGEGIQEAIESYEVMIKGKIHRIKSVRNLCGHTIEPYRIHAGKSVPIVAKEDNAKMAEGEIYAIETFATTGNGTVIDIPNCSHYMKDETAVNCRLRSDRARALFDHIDKNYSTLAFCRRWLAEAGFQNHSLPLRQLINAGLILSYPPLADCDGSYVSQFEHTIYLKPWGKEILSSGDDY